MLPVFARFAAVAVVFFAPLSAMADQFPRFTAERFEGWVEDVGTANGRISLLPIIVEPGVGFYWQAPEAIGQMQPVNPYAAMQAQGFDFAADGRIAFTYRLLTDTRYVPSNLRQQISAQTNIPLSRLNLYTTTFIPPAAVSSVELLISGRRAAYDEFPSGMVMTGSVKEGTFYLDNTKATLDALRQGDYRLVLTTSTPIAQFASIQIDHSAQAVSNSWITAFREVTKKKRRSGFNAGFIDFSHAVQKVRVEEQIRSGSTTTLDSQTDALMRDPTPAQAERFERLLGFARQNETEALQQHRAAHAAALAAGSFNLADAHEKYIEVLEDKAPGDSDQILGALAKLSNDEAMKFMTSGIRVSLGSTGTSYKYNGSLVANSSTTVKTEYNEFIIANTVVLNRTVNHRGPGDNGVALQIDAAYKRIHQRIFGVPTLGGPLGLTSTAWAQGVAGAIGRGNLSEVRYAVVDLAETGEYASAIDPNRPVDANGNRLLHRAVTSGDTRIATLLLRNGADPGQKNRFGDTPVDAAGDRGDDAMRQLLQASVGQSGEAVLRVSHPGVQLTDVRLLAPTATGTTTLTRIDASTSEIRIKGYPQRAWVSVGFVYQFVTTQQPSNFGFTTQAQWTPQGWRLTAQGMINRPVRIRNGETQSYDVALMYQGPQFGFAEQGAFDTPTAPGM